MTQFGYRHLGFGARPAANVRTQAALAKGGNASADRQKTCYLYDQIGNSWSTQTEAPTAMRALSGCTSGSDELFIPGGWITSQSATHEAFSFTGNSWSTKVAATVGGHYSTSMSGEDSYNYVNTNNSARNDEYSFTSNSFSAKNTPSYGNWQLNQSTGSSTGQIVISKGATARDDCEQFSIASNSWTTKTDAPTGNREGAGATVNANGDFHYSCGGAFSPTDANEQFSISGNSWSSKTVLLTANNGTAAASLAGDEFYLQGGQGVNQLDAYSETGNSWANKTTPTAQRRYAAWDGN